MIGCLGIGLVCFFGIGIFAMVDSQKRTAEFKSNRQDILNEMKAAAAAEDFEKVLEIGRPYTNFKDPDIDALVSEAKEATSFLGSIKRSAAESTTTPGMRVVQGDYWWGAATTELFDKLMRYSVQKDEVAFNRLMAAGLSTGMTTYFKNGEELFLTDTAIFSGKMKVRRKGETVEYWTVIEATK